MPRRNNNRTFSQLVFNGLAKIPRGRVTTYGALAKLIGRPKAYRAVGNVLNSNSRLVAVPCHRVIRADGQIGGYRLGSAKKIKILASEGVLFDKANKIKDFKRLMLKIK